MTIDKLARLIVEDYYSGSPGDEPYQIAVDQEKKKLLQTLCGDHFNRNGVWVEVEI